MGRRRARPPTTDLKEAQRKLLGSLSSAMSQLHTLVSLSEGGRLEVCKWPVGWTGVGEIIATEPQFSPLKLEEVWKQVNGWVCSLLGQQSPHPQRSLWLTSCVLQCHEAALSREGKDLVSVRAHRARGNGGLGDIDRCLQRTWRSCHFSMARILYTFPSLSPHLSHHSGRDVAFVPAVRVVQ